jgi:hypothetical protein
MNKFNKLLARAGVAAAGFGVTALSYAEGLTDAVTAETTSAKADIATAGAAIIGVVVAIAVVSWIRRVIR